MDFSLASRLRYYSKDDSANIIEKIGRELSIDITKCRHELLCLFNDIVSNVPCCYWDRGVYSQALARLEQLAASCDALEFDETMMEHFLVGYSTYMQITSVINDLSGLNDSPAIKNRHIAFQHIFPL